MIHNENCLKTMKGMKANSLDSIVTDPPYELGFMGKRWDASGISYNVDVWKEALRILKPGGHLLSFGGSRTYHRMAVAIEDAGFEIRDQIMWVYGSGFPKSLNISKSIDRMKGAEREVIGPYKYPDGVKRRVNIRTNNGVIAPLDSHTKNPDVTAPSTPEAQQWDGWGTALKPAHEPICVARKPFKGTVVENVLKWGTGGLNIDASRIEVDKSDKGLRPNSRDRKAKENNVYGVYEERKASTTHLQGRFPANLIHDGSEEVEALFPETTKTGRPIMLTGKKYDSNTKGKNCYGEYAPYDFLESAYFDSGSASRFFYCAKASKLDRDEGLEGFEEKEVLIALERHKTNPTTGKLVVDIPRANFHPTVKPTSLMRYLVKLITPPNGICYDPFTGSGSTGKACALEGFEFIGSELDKDYCKIAEARIQYAKDYPEIVGRELERNEQPDNQTSMF